MKTLFLKSILILLTCTLYLVPSFAQTPEKISYQAIVRDVSNNLVTNQVVGMKISILQGSINGTAVYEEIYNPNPLTNTNGLVSIEIGGGVPIFGTFSSIDWSVGPYFIKTETDPTGGTNYTIIGTSQLLSVPYALFANTTEQISGPINEIDPVFNVSISAGISGADTANWNAKPDPYSAGPGIDIINDTVSVNNSFYLGQDTLGGIVYYIYLDKYGQQRGLILSKIDTTVQWLDYYIPCGANRSDDGAYNTSRMDNSPFPSPMIVWLHSHFTSEWYIPSVDELNLLCVNRFFVNKALENAGLDMLYYAAIPGTFFGAWGVNNGVFWSSTETGPFLMETYGYVKTVNTLTFYVENELKTELLKVRAIRAF